MDYPAIHPNFLSSEYDGEVAIATMKVSRDLVKTKALSPFVEEELDPGPGVVTDDELLNHARNTATTIYHPSGTCKMRSSGDASAVVDTQLRVHGIDNLRVADASIMPTITSGNTNAPTIMIGEKAADMILNGANKP